MTTPSPYAKTGAPPPDFVLWDGDACVGWTEGDRIGFTGFADAREAAWAAAVAQTAIARRQARGGTDGPRVDLSRLTLVKQANQTWVESNGQRIARLVPPGDGPNIGGGSDALVFGFEIELGGRRAS